MASTKKIQEEAMSYIDAAKAVVEKVLSIMEIINISPSLTLSFATNPIGLLLQLLKHLGVKYEDLRNWLTNFLIYVVPLMEIAVKAILLTNLKNMISCSVDPRIPDKYRKRHKSSDDTQSSQEYGIDVSIEAIDFLGKLSISPLSNAGSYYYFGLEGIDDVYKFARALDFDAFLWFVIHKAKFPNAAKISDMGHMTDDIHGNQAEKISPSDATLLAPFEATFSSGNPSSILVGNTFTYTGSSHVISMCIDRKYDETANSIVKNTMVPISDDWNSANWYTSAARRIYGIIGNGKTDSQASMYNSLESYQDEKPICNLQYLDQSIEGSSIVGTVNNKLRFTILPKPLIHVPNLSNGEPPWRFKKLLFNEKGEYDANGKYTIADVTDNENGEYLNGKVKIDPKSGHVSVSDKTELITHLMECYKGLTVYEFNYDYVMSLKLFDAKVLATTLLDSLINMNVGVSGSIGIGSNTYEDATERIKEIVKNIVYSDDSSVSDCYFSFDNSKYDTLLRKAEEKRAKQQKFGNTTKEVGSFQSVTDILEEYNTTSTLNEQVDVLNRAITQASVTLSEAADSESDKWEIENNLVFDLIENLVMAITNGVLSPKVLLLFEVNQKMMGGTWEAFSVEDLIKAMSQVIMSIVTEIRDLIVQELLKFVIEQLRPIIETLSALILQEQLEDYADILADIIKNCPKIWWFKIGNSYQDTTLDTVDYADIDTSTTSTSDEPKTNNC